MRCARLLAIDFVHRTGVNGIHNCPNLDSLFYSLPKMQKDRANTGLETYSLFKVYSLFARCFSRNSWTNASLLRNWFPWKFQCLYFGGISVQSCVCRESRTTCYEFCTDVRGSQERSNRRRRGRFAKGVGLFGPFEGGAYERVVGCVISTDDDVRPPRRPVVGLYVHQHPFYLARHIRPDTHAPF